MAFSFVLATLVARNALSCSCSPQSYGPACSLVTTRDIIFTGRVDFSNDDGSGKFTQGTVVRFAVEEVFKGLPAGTKEAWIDPGSFTSCYVEFEVGKRYLVFASDSRMAEDSIVAMTVMGDGKQRKPVPPGFDVSNPPKVYLSAGCHGSRPLESAESDLKWLRAWVNGATDTRIFGRVLEHYAMYFVPPLDEPPLAGALVSVRGSGGSYRAISNQNGAYEINGVVPGKYILSASLDRYRPVENIKLEIAPKACAYVNIGLRTTGIIRGIVRRPDGMPVVGVSLEIARVLADGKLKHEYQTREITDSNGRFGFDELPSGDFLLGVNLQRGPTLRIPYLTTYYPGTLERKSAQLIHLDPAGQRTGLSFRLPAKLRERDVSVRVQWPDGRPAAGVPVFAEGSHDGGGFSETDAEGRARLPCLEGLGYKLWARYFVDKEFSRKLRRIVGGSTELAAGTKPAHLKIILNKPGSIP